MREDGYMSEIVCFNGPDDSDGACVDRRCPTCARYASSKDAVITYNGFGDVTKIEGFVCKRCGPFEPGVIGWKGDFFND